MKKYTNVALVAGMFCSNFTSKKTYDRNNASNPKLCCPTVNPNVEHFR